MISVFYAAQDAIFFLFISVPNKLQLEFGCNVDKTGAAVRVNEERWKQKYFEMLFITHILLWDTR